MRKLVFPIVVSIRDEAQMALVRDALLLVREAMIKDWNLWMHIDAARRESIQTEIASLEEILDQCGWTKS